VDKGDYAGAIADFSYNVDHYPNDEFSYEARAGAKADKGDVDGAIADYSKAIEIDPKYASAYNGRGVVKFQRGNLDGAIADYTKCIDVDFEPSATTYWNRGLARKAKGDLDGAIADYSKVIELQPDDAQAYWDRGCLRYDSQDFTNALADFRLLAGDGPALRIWLIRARAGETAAATTDLQTYLTGRTTGKPDDWFSKIGHFLTGQLTESEFLAAAANATPKTNIGLCQAYFYAGSKHLVSGDKVTAMDYFQKSVATNQKDYEEYSSAAAELELLKAKKN
jgi:tetratricopeptide (TPR) repeat protein